MTNPAFVDGFNLLCGEKIASGYSRDVFECRIRKDLVVKVERNSADMRTFCNVQEQLNWDQNQYHEKVAKWLAPCRYLSKDGLVLLQVRCEPLPASYKVPDKLPAFLTDIKRENFGLLDGRLVCVDYASLIPNYSLRQTKVFWTPPDAS